MEDDVRLYLKTHRGPDGLMEIGGNKTIFTSPTILCCGGNRCTHGSQDQANGFSKRVEALINTLNDGAQKPFRVITTTYDDRAIDEVSFSINEGRDTERFKEFVDTHFVPLLTGIDGQKLPIEQVQANFRNIQVVTHSFGAAFIQQVGNLLVGKMQELGFSQRDIDQATSQILVITAGSSADISKGKAKFTRVNVYHGNDTKPSTSVNTRPAKILRSTLPENDYFARTVSCDKTSGEFKVNRASREAIVMSKTIPGLRTDPLRLDDADDAAQLERKNDPDFHAMDTYFSINLDHGGTMLRTAMAVALYNGLQNSVGNASAPGNFTPLPPPKDLLGMPKDGVDRDFIRLARGIGYEKRMKMAFSDNPHLESTHAKSL